MKYTIILFDLDGTLFDYDRAEETALVNTFAHFSIEFLPEYLDLYREINTALWKAYEQGRVSQSHIKVERFVQLAARIGTSVPGQELSRLYLRYLAGGTFLMDGAEDLIRRLKGRLRLALITNGLTAVQKPRLRKSALNGLFEAFFISEEIGFAKPDARIFSYSLEKLGHPERAEVLMVGDSLTSDIAGAAGFGIDTCWFNPTGIESAGGARPTYTISRLAELIPIVMNGRM